MSLNTAVLYDIENLVGGYKNLDASDLSLRDIHEAIVDIGVKGIAIQKAYANWSDRRLNILRSDIVELGIEPVQMFGFGRGQEKNASDIQLAIDAVEIAAGKPWVEEFVIVSGDGGFAFLAKKLHEFGKRVVGCAYKRSVNHVFEAVCDAFIWIDEPQQITRDSAEGTPGEVANPIVRAFAQSYNPVTVKNRESSFEEATATIKFLEANHAARSSLTGDGMNLSVLAELLRYRIQDFNYVKFGFDKLTDFVSYVTKSSHLDLVFKPPSEYRLVLRGSSLRGFEKVEGPQQPNEVDSAYFYRKVLARSHPGQPRYRLPSVEVLDEITHHLCDNKVELFSNLPVDGVIEALESAVAWDQGAVKDTVLTLIGAGCFVRTPEDSRLAEQLLSFRFNSQEETLDLLQQRFLEKLATILGSVDTDILAQLLPADKMK